MRQVCISRPPQRGGRPLPVVRGWCCGENASTRRGRRPAGAHGSRGAARAPERIVCSRRSLAVEGSCAVAQEELDAKATDARSLEATVRQLADRMDRLEASSLSGTLRVRFSAGRHSGMLTKLRGPCRPERCRISRIAAAPAGPGARDHPVMVGHVGRPECQGRRAQHPRRRPGWCAGVGPVHAAALRRTLTHDHRLLAPRVHGQR